MRRRGARQGRVTAACANTGVQVQRAAPGPPDWLTCPASRPRTFELVINLRSARAIGLVVPQALLLRATRTIE